MNLDVFNAAFAALDDDSERSMFLVGLSRGMNGGPDKDSPGALGMGFKIGQGMRQEAEGFRAKKTADGLKGGRPRVNQDGNHLVNQDGNQNGTQSTILNPLTNNPKPEAKPRASKKPSWKGGFEDDILDATTEIIGFWPNESRRQPNSDSRVPRSSGPQLAARLSRIKQSGGDLSVCVAIAKRAVDEFEHGKWAKAAENFFGKSEDAPWIAYYQAHTTNMETADAP